MIDGDGVKAADRLAVADGFTLEQLIRAAGHAIAGVAEAGLPAGSRIAVWAGPGMNGADARVAAERLAERHQVTIFSLRGAKGPSLDEFPDAPFDLVIDGLFGTGLQRPLDATCREAIRRLEAGGSPVLSIDVPSGIHTASGAVLGAAVRAQRTVTFQRRRAAHLLMPGRLHSGQVIVADIGIPDSVWERVPAVAQANEPPLWLGELRHPSDAGHKYDRGHAVVFSGALEKSGAARLSAIGALRGGAGLVTLAAPRAALAGLSAQVTAIMLRGCDDGAGLATLLEDERFNTFVLGPGFGDQDKARAFAGLILEAGRALVLDADGITAFGAEPDTLFALRRDAAASRVVLTPHDGEFKRLFPDLAGDAAPSKLDAARAAAQRAGGIVVYKGADTVIAAPDGRAAVNATGTPWLATAGTGDVLAGIVAAQLAQGTPAFEAACAGVWMHGRGAELFGPGLISEDLPGALPRVHAEIAALRGG
ncbi:NAD(P)H-hydrate dehydratase [Aureimonas sp. SK2]|uniref:NAD(P)H-hydrate dehydratase n=1 Tax=Aureimonas sp. SK2 TaxID=3015992 RepID=UPI002443891E|nr:NAD(P)H-hydrate dehydratase [Aureimonas sp. SK2]